MNHVELVQKYSTVHLEVILSDGKITCMQNGVESQAIMTVTAKGVYISFGRNYLSRGEDVMYPLEAFKGKLVPYKYGTNFKTIDLARSEYEQWVEEFTEQIGEE